MAEASILDAFQEEETVFWIHRRETKRASIPILGQKGHRRKNSHYLRQLHEK